jgi:hypothetical protein
MLLSLAEVLNFYERLRKFRAEGRGPIYFDSRDHGNYGEYDFPEKFEMLCQQDPTGLAAGMMLECMVQATISGSKVLLQDLLEVPFFLEKMEVIDLLRTEMAERIGEKRDAFVAAVTASLTQVIGTPQSPKTLEVAVCLRDACYSAAKGLKLNWLVCDEVTHTPQSLPISGEARRYPTLPAFLLFLKNEALPGAYLACVGNGHTVIGLKFPGRIAYLSSLDVNMYSGQLLESRADNYHMAESFDLQTAVERYPDWRKLLPDNKEACPLTDAPRDRLLWLALVIEMTRQKMYAADPKSVLLSAVMLDALPAPMLHGKLPALVSKPAWTIPDLSVTEAFASLQLTPWERKLLEPAISLVSVRDLLPVGHYKLHMSVSGPIGYVEPRLRFGGDMDPEFAVCHAEITPLSPELTGTLEQLKEVRAKMLVKNLTSWLETWAEHEIARNWVAMAPLFAEKVEARIPELLASPRRSLVDESMAPYGALRFFHQSPKHKGFCAMSYLNKKKRATHAAVVHAKSAQQIADSMGIAESELPAWLQGWERTEGKFHSTYKWEWQTFQDLHRVIDIYDPHRRVPHYFIFTAVVFVTEADLPEVAAAPQVAGGRE